MGPGSQLGEVTFMATHKVVHADGHRPRWPGRRGRPAGAHAIQQECKLGKRRVNGQPGRAVKWMLRQCGLHQNAQFPKTKRTSPPQMASFRHEMVAGVC